MTAEVSSTTSGSRGATDPIRLRRIAIVNRGDAALRLIRAVREHNFQHGTGLVTIALHSEEEATATFVREADEAVSLGPAYTTSVDGSRRLSYVDEDALGRALRCARADGAWVGWGFVSERPEFAEQCEALGVHMIGPSAAVMRQLGDKVGAKRLAESVDVPVVSWSGGVVGDVAQAEDQARRIGFPLMIKAAAGGGGRGIRRVARIEDLAAAYSSAQREASSAFGDGSLFLERAVTTARHVEVQVAADAFGEVRALGVRDCSVQRRRQKIVEESGVPGVGTEVVDRIRAAAVRLMESTTYVGLGTVEFLLDAETGDFYFMEVNTRLQVEHTVTEEATGLDLVKLQLELAQGGSLGPLEVVERGYAIEARVTAEDPLDGFRPAPGTIVDWRPAAGPGLRMDTGISAGDPTPSEYDPLLVKIVARGADRDEALARLRRGVEESRLVVEGGSTTLGFLRWLLTHPQVRSGGASTDLVDRLVAGDDPIVDDRSDLALLLVAVALAESRWQQLERDLFSTAARGRAEVVVEAAFEVELGYRAATYRLAVSRVGAAEWAVLTADGPVRVRTVAETPHERVMVVGAHRLTASVVAVGDMLQVSIDGSAYHVFHGSRGTVSSPLPAMVVGLRVAVGDDVAAGDVVAVLESMKLETPVVAPRSGTVRELYVDLNAQVAAGDRLLRMDDASEEEASTAAAVSFTPLVHPASEEDAVAAGISVLLGYDGIAGTRGPAAGRDRLRDESRLLDLFARCAAVTSATPYAEPGTAHALRGADAMARLLAAPHRGIELVPEDWYAELVGLLSLLGVSNVDDPAALRDGLHRVSRAAAGLPALEPLVAGVLRSWLGAHPDGDLVELDLDLVERAAIAGEASYPLVGDLAWATLRHHWLLPQTEGVPETVEDARSLLEGLGYRAERWGHHERHEVDGVAVWVPREADDDVPTLVLGRPGSWTHHLAGVLAGSTYVEILLPRGAASDPAELTQDVAAAAQALTGSSCRRVTISAPGSRGRRLMAAWATPVGEAGEAATIPVETSYLHPSTAERLEFWRFANFHVRHRSSRGDIHVLELTARDNDADRRLVAVAGVAVQPSADPQGTVRAVEPVLLEAFAQIRESQALVPLSERSQLNRVVLYAEGPWTVPDADLQQVSRRLAPAARNLGVERVVVRVQVRQDGSEGEGEGLVDRVLHLTGPAEAGLMLGVTAPSSAPMRTMSPRQQHLLRLHRRGLWDPYEIADLMVARNASVSDFPAGRFTELDLDAEGRLAAVSRPAGENTAGLVVGLIENTTTKHPEGMTRVILLGDPGRGLGALSEAECRRAVAALDLAERRGVPLEWFSVSSGAKISMTSGTENLDWTARVLRRLIEVTQAGLEVNVVLVGVNVGAQSYFDAEATMLMHTRGILVMTPGTSMVLTGKDALDFAGGVSAEDNVGIGGYTRVMGPNGQAQYAAGSLQEACSILFQHYDHTYVATGDTGPRRAATTDPVDRDVTLSPHPEMRDVEFRTIGEIFSETHNPGRNKPFDMRTLMAAVVDADHRPLERWRGMVGAEGTIVWDAHLGGIPVCLLGIESRPLPRAGVMAADGPQAWSAATLFPLSSKKLARALNAASGNRPAVVLANLAGFDGSPESLRNLQLEYGAEIGRAVTNFAGPVVFCVVSRYHGGAFVVFSKALNSRLEVLALEGARASVIGGSAAAAVVFGREVERRVAQDPRVATSAARADRSEPGVDRSVADAEREVLRASVRSEVRRGLADEFDDIHTVERALDVGSVDRIIGARTLRPSLIESLERGLAAQDT